MAMLDVGAWGKRADETIVKKFETSLKLALSQTGNQAGFCHRENIFSSIFCNLTSSGVI